MKVNTILKAGTLAFDIFNHQSTQALGGLVKNGIKRRSSTFGAPHSDGQSAAATQAGAAEPQTAPSFLDRLFTPPAMPRQRMPQRPPGQQRGGFPYAPYGARSQGPHGGPYAHPQFIPVQTPPSQHIKKALQYVTPENMQKAMQWHGIIKSFISKD